MAEAVRHDKTARQLRMLSDALDSGRLGPVRRMVNTLSPAEIGNLLESLPPGKRSVVWGLVDAEDDGEPDAVETGSDGSGEVAGAEPAGDQSGRAVGEEDEDAGRGGQGRAGGAETGKLGRAEVADDGGVGQEEEGFGDEGEEGRDGQPQDLGARARGGHKRRGYAVGHLARCDGLSTGYPHVLEKSDRCRKGGG